MSKFEEFEKIKRISAEFRILLSADHGVSNISDAMDRMGIPTSVMLDIHQFTYPEACIAGPAVTVRGVVHRGIASKSGFKYILEAREAAKQRGSGCVMVYSTHKKDALALGSCMGTGLEQAGIIAAVTDSGVRDVAGLKKMKFPVWARKICARDQGSRVEYVGAMETVECNGVQVRPGDIVVGDESGVVVVPLEYAEEALERVKAAVKREHYLLTEMREKGTDYPMAIRKMIKEAGIKNLDWFE
jgi:4-hydroxy-4-methyl-2-oxoglutarate aldolase